MASKSQIYELLTIKCSDEDFSYKTSLGIHFFKFQPQTAEIFSATWRKSYAKKIGPALAGSKANLKKNKNKLVRLWTSLRKRSRLALLWSWVKTTVWIAGVATDSIQFIYNLLQVLLLLLLSRRFELVTFPLSFYIVLRLEPVWPLGR